MALGKGLGALLPEFEQVEPKTLFYCGIEEIIPNRSQPRKHFDESKLQELAESIKEKGILEPLIVRRADQGYELIIGERRWRAAQKAGLKEVPVVVKEVEGREVLEISLIENLQREDLNPIEAAEAFKHLIEEFHISQEDLSKRIGKDRTTITNTLRLLKLPLEVRKHFKDKVFRTIIPRNIRLSEAPSHGKPILLYDVHSKGTESYLNLAREIMMNGKINGN